MVQSSKLKKSIIGGCLEGKNTLRGKKKRRERERERERKRDIEKGGGDSRNRVCPALTAGMFSLNI